MNCGKGTLLLYAVTDRSWLNGKSLGQAVREAIEGGATMIQLREKEMDTEALIREAREIGRICREYKTPFVVNDSVEAALAAGADGVHVGQKDMEAGRVRELLGPDKILGVSVQTADQARLACERGADYLGVGAVFPTGTKTDAKSVSVQELKAICQAVRIPVVAIGGISRENAALLEGSGIQGIAVVSAVFAQKDIRAAARGMREAAEWLTAAALEEE